MYTITAISDLLLIDYELYTQSCTINFYAMTGAIRKSRSSTT